MKKEGSNLRKERAVETKAKLYESADRLFTEHGVDTVSVDTIVAAAGVSKGTFYVHFESKDALVASLVSDYVEKADMDYKAFLDAFPPETPTVDILMSLVSKVFDVIINTIGYERMRTLYKVQLTGAVYTHTVTSYNRALYQLLGDVVERGVLREEFQTSLTVNEVTRHLIQAMRGLIYEWCIRYPDFDLKTQARTHFELLTMGIACHR